MLIAQAHELLRVSQVYVPRLSLSQPRVLCQYPLLSRGLTLAHLGARFKLILLVFNSASVVEPRALDVADFMLVLIR